MFEIYVDELFFFEDMKLFVEKVKRWRELKMKVYWKKKIDEIMKELEVIVVEENWVVEDDFWLSDEIDEKYFDFYVDED